MNAVMIVFICVSALLSSTSITLLYSSTHMISSFLDAGKVADQNMLLYNVSDEQQGEIEIWIQEEKYEDISEVMEIISSPVSALSIEGDTLPDNSGPYLTTASETLNLMYDQDDQPIHIRKGEVGIPSYMRETKGYQIGDTFQADINGTIYTYRIQCFVKDPLMGSPMIGMKRFLFHPDDFTQMKTSASAMNLGLILSFQSDSVSMKKIENSYQAHDLPNYISLVYDTVYLASLSVQGGTCAMPLLTGILLLFISMITMRFAIIFQLENNYSEIGIMKAMGFRNRKIKLLYLVKYISITLIGSILGYICSLPLSQLLDQAIKKDMINVSSNTGILISATILPAMILMVYLFASFIMRKIQKQSAMDGAG